MPTSTKTPDMAGEVNSLVSEGWHFKSTGNEYVAHNDDNRYFRCSKLADVVAAIRESEAANQEATETEQVDTAAALFDAGVDADTQAALSAQE